MDFWSKTIPYGQLWRQWASQHDHLSSNFDQRMQCYLAHIDLGSLAIAAIQNDLEDYTRIKARMQMLLTPA